MRRWVLDSPFKEEQHVVLNRGADKKGWREGEEEIRTVRYH